MQKRAGGKKEGETVQKRIQQSPATEFWQPSTFQTQCSQQPSRHSVNESAFLLEVSQSARDATLIGSSGEVVGYPQYLVNPFAILHPLSEDEPSRKYH